METDIESLWKFLVPPQQVNERGVLTALRQASTSLAEFPIRVQSIVPTDELREVGGATPSQYKIYPHAFDEEEPIGAARLEYQKALTSIRACSESLADGDFGAVSGRLSDAALIFKAAHANLDRDDPLAALTGYLRRAVLAADPSEISRAGMEALQSVVASTLENPVVTLLEAAELSDQLEQAGWNGDEPNAAALFAAILVHGDPDAVESPHEALRSD